MGLEADLAAFSAKLDNDVALFMSTRGLNIAKAAIIMSLFENVYSYQSPAKHPYERRYDNGGLSDPQNIVADYDLTYALPDGFQLTVKDVANDEEGLPVAEIIESGQGYHWTESEMYQKQIPRPFYEEAEKIAAADLPNELKAWLTSKGYEII